MCGCVCMGADRWRVVQVTLGGTRLKSVPASYSLSILDTGTPTINLPNVPFASFVGSLLATCNTTSPLAGVCNVPKGSKSLLQGGCASLSPQDLARFPALSFHIGGASGGGVVEVAIPASRCVPVLACGTGCAMFVDVGTCWQVPGSRLVCVPVTRGSPLPHAWADCGE